MGWFDRHLHEFRVKGLGRKEFIFGIPDEEFDYDEILPGWKHKISRFIDQANPVCEYVYDFGDNWRHKVELEDILPAEKDVSYPRCLKGKRACPPEDCGGPWGYEELLAVLAAPEHEEYEDSKAWIESMKGGHLIRNILSPQRLSSTIRRKDSRWYSRVNC